ncbi:unnamed protein product [Cuscuta campestris]|uniref:Uncharacterized protein n=1 Tax=Cuscuta campestris TaxID=132261 RepID=A0A484LAQ2_9ASTE|nr:unnamed protein product [Cuscuta campestris]
MITPNSGDFGGHQLLQHVLLTLKNTLVLNSLVFGYILGRYRYCRHGLSVPRAVLTPTSTTSISAATSFPSSKASALSRVAITVAAAAVLSAIAAAAVFPAVGLTAGSGGEQGCAAGVNGIVPLAIQKHESRSNLKKIRHKILKRHERGLSLKICGKPSEHLEDQLVLRDRCVDVQPVGKILEFLTIGLHGGRAFDGGAKFMF